MTTSRPSSRPSASTRFSFSALIVAFLLFVPNVSATAQEKIVIAADAGAAGPLANTLPAVVLATTMDIDFIELKLVATRDNALIVYHDLLLDQATNVAKLFPEKMREDGHYYVVDCTLAEIRQLRRVHHTESHIPVPALGIPTFDETLSLLKALENEQKQQMGIAINILQPEFHRIEGKDVSNFILQSLYEYGYGASPQLVILQCLDGDELQRIKKDILPEMGMEFALVQLINQAANPAERNPSLSAPYDHTWMFTRLGLRVVSSYADSIALHTSYLDNGQGGSLPVNFLDDARSLGLKLYTFPLVDDQLTFPAFATSYSALIDHYCTELGFDGVITSSSRSTAQYRQQKREKEQQKAAATPPSNLPPFFQGQQNLSQSVLHSNETP